ncbi:GerMN domain-containing protein [Paenibacillus sp. PR3]|uniref:GerMN domain-containing protein n=1 Tax=Paenibacillus terricola TaxID=2763503 RepID=A0ABR8MSB0_9BACL|nr:GerMN domain-containing protein [Paenibacillus terricola]MBD3918857.1 GerMN domain-containing protein [Paenibacillus terricola]
MMRQLRTTIGLLLLSAALVTAATGCGTKDKSPQANANTDTNVSAAGDQSEQPSSSEKTKQSIHIYYSDQDLTTLVELNREIEYDSPDQKIAAALSALQTDGSIDALSLWSKAQFLSSSVKDGAVTIDVHLPEGARLGAPGEMLALQALKQTLFQFDDVQSIDVLEDGEAVDTLMGHEELPHPFVK